MDLVVNLEKAAVNRGPLDTSKLVRKPVQVKGSNGKIFTRMQWVDPSTGKPVSESHASPPQHPVAHHEKGIEEAEKTKKKTYDLSTQEGHIDHTVDKMDKHDKRALAEKHNLKWEHNDHDLIEHKNMVVALKNHLKNNPHLAGAEHLPKADAGLKTPTGGDATNNWLNNLGKADPEKLYDLMRHCGVVPLDSKDPRTLPEYSAKPVGNGMGAIHHMKNMMALKRHLGEHPEVTQDPKWSTDRLNPTTGIREDVPVEDHHVDKDFNMQQMLTKMSREDKYSLARKLGVAERDPRERPELQENNRHATEHARNMTKLAKILEKNPELLGDASKYGVDDKHMDVLKEKSGKVSTAGEIRDTVKEMPMDLRVEAVNKFRRDGDFPAIPKVDSDHPDAKHIRNMHISSALQKYFLEHPDKYKPYKEAVDYRKLRDYPIGNKVMARALKHFFGLKGVGDVMNNHDEKGHEREWLFGNAQGSWARVEKQDGVLTLSVVDTGKEGDEWNEFSVPLSKVRDWIEGGEQGEAEEALHNKPLGEIESALHRNFNHFYTPDVGETLKPIIRGAWEASGYSNDPEALTKYFNSMDAGDIGKVLDKYGIPLKDGMLNTASNKWKHLMWGHLIEDTKTKSAHDYVVDVGGKPELYVLHESASKWSPEERTEARKDILGKGYSVSGIDGLPDASDRSSKLLDLTHLGTEHIPFDLLSDMMISNGLKVKFSNTDSNGNPIQGSKYSNSDKTLYLDGSYALHDNLHSIDHPIELMSSNSSTIHTLDNGEKVSTVPSVLSDDIAHEFAHAMQYHLSKGDIRNGMVNDVGKKYLGEHTGVLSASYNIAMRTNPKHYVGQASDSEGNHMYYYHKDHWINSYEGRIYGDKYSPSNPNNPIQKSSKTGALVDTGYTNLTSGHEHGRGMEHFAHSVARYANALHAYRRWKEGNPGDTSSMADWAKSMSDQFSSRGYGTDWEAASSEGKVKPYTADNASYTYEDEANGFLYHKMQENHKSMCKAIDRLLNRPDFQSKGLDLGAVTSQYEKGDYSRKSEVPVILYLDRGSD